MGGTPNQGTPKDKRLKENKRKPKRSSGSRKTKRAAKKGR